MIFSKKKSLPPPTHWKINQNVLDLIFECAKSSYPNEFGGFLKTDTTDSFIITELVLIPGTISGDAHAIFQMHMLPIDYTIIGTVHSHPSPNSTPSSADLTLFERYGKIHIISGYPYNNNSWNAYSYKGDKLKLQII